MTKQELIDFLEKGGYLRTSAIIKAFDLADRKNFVPEENKDEAYDNKPFAIAGEEVITQPILAALLAEFLEPKSGENILEIGTGSGWLTAIIAFTVCGENKGSGFEFPGKVLSIEHSSVIRGSAEKNLESLGLVSGGAVELLKGNGLKGYKKNSPYDRIIAGVSVKSIPLEWKNQLKIGGRIVAPVGSTIVVLDKTGKEEFRKREYFGFQFTEAKE